MSKDFSRVWQCLSTIAGILTGIVVVSLLVIAHLVVGVVLHNTAKQPPVAATPPPGMVERLQRQKVIVAHGQDHGPLRCSLSPGDRQSELRVTLTNASDEAVTIRYHS